MGEPGQDSRIRFGVFELDMRPGELRKAGTRIRLQDQPLKVLVALLEQPGEVVTREELKRRIWPEESFGDFDHAVNVAVAKLRAALADSADAPRFVETLPRRGYRFIFPVTLPTGVPAGAASTAVEERLKPTKRTPRFRWAVVTGATIVVVGLAVSAWWSFSRKTHVLTERDTIVLADFTNTTGDPVFDGTLRQGLSVQLEQSPFLSIVSDQQIQQTLQMMGQKPDAKLTPETTREVCQRTSGAAVLDGSIVQIGTQYSLILKATSCVNGESLTSTEAQASDKNHVLEALGRASSTIRTKLGESLATVQKFDTPLEQATTPSLEALKAFSLAQRSGEIPLFQHAVELDSKFALAYAALADEYGNFGESELASEYAQKAFDLRERVTERERLHILASYYYATLGDLDQELRTYLIWEQMYPRDWAPWDNSAASRDLLGDYTGALMATEQALRLDPNQSICYSNRASILLSLNRREEAKQITQQARARGFDVRIHDYLIAFLENDTKGMEAQLSPSSGRPVPISLVAAQSGTEAYFGRLRKSLGLSRRALEMARRAKLNELAALIQDTDAFREAEFGNPGQALQAAITARTLSRGRGAKIVTSLVLARAGDVTRAQALADELSRQFPSDTLLQRYWLPTIRGSIELARENPSKALTALQSVSYELGDAGFAVGAYCAANLYPSYVRGQAYLGMRQGKKAAVEFQKLLDHRSIVLNSPLGALAYLGLARAYSFQGDAAKARGAYQDFLALWKDADPDIPIFQQARAEYAKMK
jgi:DNA-binding winged helix-turn-helix (wHTH) protein/predicted Zn-dependent protease